MRDEAAWEAAIRTLTPLEPWTADGSRRADHRRRVDGPACATASAASWSTASRSPPVSSSSATPPSRTNPWYGKGCSLAGIAAEELSEALAEHGRDRVALAHAMDAAVRAELEPHYTLAVRQDADRMKLHGAMHDGSEPDPMAVATRDFVYNGLLPATRMDPDVFRAFFRSFNMLDAPDALMADPKVLTAAFEAHAQEGRAAAGAEARPRARRVPRRDGRRRQLLTRRSVSATRTGCGSGSPTTDMRERDPHRLRVRLTERVARSCGSLRPTVPWVGSPRQAVIERGDPAMQIEQGVTAAVVTGAASGLGARAPTRWRRQARRSPCSTSTKRAVVRSRATSAASSAR